MLSLGISGLSQGGNGDDHHSPGLENFTLLVIREGDHLVSLGMLQMSGCLSLFTAVPSIFLQIRSLNRSELSLSALFLILSPLKNLSLLFWASENVTALMPLLCYYTGNEIYSWKSINSKGDIHLYESSQLERKT